jgi:RNA polymerase sigma-70 factor, ECF subfamily
MIEPDPPPTLRQVFDEHARYVWRVLRHLGVPDAELDDLCQDVFLVVHRQLPSFEGRSKLSTWLYGICVRTASDYRRRARVRYERASADPAASLVAPGGFEPDARIGAKDELLHLLATLDDDKRTVLVLYEIEGLGMNEIAEIVGCPLQTAYSRLHAARALVLAASNRLEPTTESR